MVEIIRARKGPITLVGIGIEPEEPFVLVNGTQQLTAYAKPRAASKGSITWSSSPSSFVSIDTNGIITGKRSQYTATVRATSDTGIYRTVTARCGLDVTAISLPDSKITIEGIQGIEYALSVTPSNATMISFGASTTDENIAEYQWLSPTFGNGKRLWGLGVGTATITVFGRSGKASHSVEVTVNPVSTTGLEIRGNNNSEKMDEGDYIPPILERRIMFVNQRDTTVSVFFLPFNATERNITISSTDESVADVYESYPQPDVRNFGRGTLRRKVLTIHPKSVGITTITVTGANGTSASFDVDIRDVGSFKYTAAVSANASTDGRATLSGSVSLTEFTGWTFALTSSTNASSISYASEAGRNPNTSYVVGYSKSEGGKTATIRGAYAFYYDQDGNRVTISNVSGSASW